MVVVVVAVALRVLKPAKMSSGGGARGVLLMALPPAWRPSNIPPARSGAGEAGPGTVDDDDDDDGGGGFGPAEKRSNIEAGAALFEEEDDDEDAGSAASTSFL